MIEKIIEFSLKQRQLLILILGFLLCLGIFSLFRLPIDAVPDITNVQVQVNTPVLALAPEEIERLVTFPIETEMSGIPGAIEVRSLSKYGLSQVNVIFKDGTDIYRARYLVGERLGNAAESLPSGLSPKLAPIATGLGEIYYYVLDYKADATNRPGSRPEELMELKAIQDFVVKPQLRAVAGVAEVNTSGGHEKQIVVMPYIDKLTATSLSFADLAKAVSENVRNAGGGAVEVGGEQITIRAVGRVVSAEEIAEIPVKFRIGRDPVRIRDVAEVGIGSGIRTGTSTYNGKEAVLGAAIMLAGENSRIVAKRVHEKIDEIGKRLPPGVEIITGYNRMELVERTIRTVGINLFEGAVLVIMILLFLLGSWRAALIVSLAIPLSFLMAVTGMVQSKVSGNLMSLGAIDFGLIVDGAVVMIENIVRRLSHAQSQRGGILSVEEHRNMVREAALEVARPTFFGVAIITIVYIPILSLTGIEGKMFKPMAFTVIFALVGSLFLSLTVMPVLASYFLRGKITEKDSWLIRKAKEIYRPVLQYAFRKRWLLAGISLVLFVFSLFVFSRLGAEFVPQLDEGSFATHMIRTTSIGLGSSIDFQEKAEKYLLKYFPEVSYTFSRIGTAEVATDPMGVNVSDTYIFFSPKEKWRKINGKRLSKDELANKMSEELGIHIPGQAYLFSQPIEMRFNEILEGTRADIAVKVFGKEFPEIERIAGEIREILEKIRGAADVEFDALGKAPVFEIIPKRKALAIYNVHAEELNEAIEAAFAGSETGALYDGNRKIPIVLRLAEVNRKNLDLLRKIPVRTPDGGLIPLDRLADFRVVEQVAAIAREMGERRAAIMVNLRGRDVESFVKEANEKIKKEVSIPQGYWMEFGGQFQNLQEARKRLAIIVPVALLVIFVLIFVAFGSFRETLIIYTGIPLAVSGGIFALWARGLPFSISAGIGFIALSGIAVLNGVMLLSYFNQLRKEGMSALEAATEGSLTRLRPVLMTALVASLGFLPMAIATGAGAEVQRPLATVVIGGVLTATFLTLVILPTLYVWIHTRFADHRKGGFMK